MGRNPGGHRDDTLEGWVASAICVTRPTRHQAIVFIPIDGESLTDDHRDPAVEGDPYTEEGGEG